MGHSSDAVGKPVFTPTPTQTVADLQAAADYADKVGGLLKGTKSEREGLTSGQVRTGWLFVESDTGAVYERTASGWTLVWTSAALSPWGSNTPAARTPLFKSGRASGTVSSGGVMAHTFPTAFPGGCVFVGLANTQNSADTVLVEASVSAAGFQTLWPGVTSGSAAVNYFAVGY